MPGQTLLADRLRDELLDEITSAQLKPGTKLPTEGELSKRFGVSRATVREAVRGLVEAGYVIRRRGSGSYVAERRRMPHGLDSTLSYLAMIESAGSHAGMRVLDAVYEQSAKIDSVLQLKRGEKVLAVERVRTADDQPVIYSRDRIPARLLDENLDLRNLDPSLFALLRSSGHAADHATATLRAVPSTNCTAKVLGVRRGKPLLYIEEIDYDKDGTPVMLSREWHVSEAFDVRINRRARPEPNLAER
ncbi:GntR family transcriptional regulator [Mycolicibacterium sp. 120270]|uniref:GntR family transcriptional regulator n=1 Tax=Mycolicibacterium sp. 120270 TaxID=3090600 RepID=UPI00299D6150|nr:GntR family transcriptional regulator [Mycolicibacterium sp. 120270]MDX1886983.1 GntR family transcriptional regulator [Mycolicibacterium sp. 120270]